MFTLKHIAGPFGDETSRYEVYFDKPTTVAEFIVEVLKNRSQEWGTFSLGWTISFIKYRYGKYLFTNEALFNEIKNKKIVSAKASGGWTAMDYILEVE